jgi:ABC-type oligopeptide transport system substrate-binding subunit
MKPQVNVDKYRIKGKRISVFIFVQMWIISSVLFFGACNQLEKPKPQPYYSQTAPPPKQEFRWSNGKMPKSFDPALAAAPPETDIIRAVSTV